MEAIKQFSTSINGTVKIVLSYGMKFGNLNIFLTGVYTVGEIAL